MPLVIAGVVTFIAGGRVTAQHIPRDEAVTRATVTYAPNSDYKASALHRFLFGTKYRKEWTIPIEMKVLDLGSFAGGLTPMKRGGFGQTTSLHMVSVDGRRFVFRSLDKDPARNLPEDLRYTFLGDVLHDQISSQHPYASLIAPKLLDASGTLHVTPHVFVMPDDPRLGVFREEFAGMIGAIEERPDDGPNGEPGFAGSEKVSSSSGMYDDLEEAARNRVDQVSFLQARLVDMFLGDRDRHFDQWRWARMNNPDGTYRWLPIPKDRDQAFRVNDGLVMAITRMYQRQYVSFGEDYGDLEGATTNGRELDRRLLVNLTKATWDSVAADLQLRLTDEVIDSAVAQLPKEVYAYDGKEMERQLRSRRDKMPEMADEFYALLADVVDLHSSDDPDVAEIDRNEDGTIHVHVRTRDGIEYFDRTFLPSETSEIRVLTHGGEDSVIVRGHQTSDITLRILPGGNDDVVIDQSSGAPTRIYDDRGDNRIVSGPETRFDDRKPHHRHPDEIFVPPDPEDGEARKAQSWGAYWYPQFLVSYSADFGLVAGGGAYFLKHSFRKQPYSYRWTIYAQGATAARGLIRTDIYFPDVSWSLQGDVGATLSSMELVRFYGFGNDFSLGARNPGDEYFAVVHAEARILASLTYRLGSNLHLTFGPEFRYVSVRDDEDNIVSNQAFFGVGANLSLPAATATFEYDSRDNLGAPAKGVHVLVKSEVVPSIFGAPEGVDTGTFGAVRSQAALYLSPNNASSNPVLALRLGGDKVFGENVPFYEAAFIGGDKNVRGYYPNRYAGDASVYGNAELRVSATHIKFIFPWEVGILGLFDGGRVWVDEDNAFVSKSPAVEIDENKIHTAYGGGIWLGVLNRRQTLSFSTAQGEEDLLFYVRAGFHF